MKKDTAVLPKKNGSQPGIKKEMKQSKLIFLFNIGSIICLIIILLSLIATTAQSRTADNQNRDRYILSECTTHFITASSYLTSESRAYAATGEKIHYDNYIEEVDKTKTRELSVEKMKEVGITTEEEGMITEMLSLSDSLVPVEKQALQDTLDGNRQNALKSLLSVDYINTLTRIQEQKLEFITSLSVRTTSEVQRCIRATRLLEIQTAALILLIIILQIAAYFITKRRVIRPIVAVEREMRNLAVGNLSEPFPYQPNTSEIGIMIDSILTTKRQLKNYIDDISEKLTRMAEKDMTVEVTLDYMGDFTPIKKSMNIIISSLNHILYRVVDSADEVASGAGQVSSDAQSLAAGTTEQAASIANISNTMNSISILVEETAAQAGMATALATAAGVKLNVSNGHLQGMLDAMKEISNASGEIGKIIKTIEDIAFQTNILALNAAVEASRAGDAGKGFAVVADEVRMLANKSADASKNTSKMIANSLNTIKNGVNIAQNASDTFVEVMINAGKAADAMGSISVASQKQSEEIKSLTENIEQIAAISENHSAISEESAAVSEQLQAHSQKLQEMVDAFHLRKSGTGKP